MTIITIITIINTIHNEDVTDFIIQRLYTWFRRQVAVNMTTSEVTSKGVAAVKSLATCVAQKL